LRNDCVDVLKNLSPDNATFSAIFELDDVDELTDEKMWVKANPNLNITVKNSWLREQVNQSQSFKSEYVNVLTKNFNRWCNAADSWIDEKYLVFKELPQFDRNEVLAYVGIDLSSVSDLTAVNFMIIKDDMYYFDTRYYLPNDFKSVNNYNTVKFR
jgi:phage terminase large subunit-like protein